MIEVTFLPPCVVQYTGSPIFTRAGPDGPSSFGMLDPWSTGTADHIHWKVYKPVRAFPPHHSHFLPPPPQGPDDPISILGELGNQTTADLKPNHNRIPRAYQMPWSPAQIAQDMTPTRNPVMVSVEAIDHCPSRRPQSSVNRRREGLVHVDGQIV